MEGIMKILCVGLMVGDILVKPISKRCLEADTTPVDTIALSGGGDAFNVACNLSSLGVQATLVSKVGNDCLGIFIKDKAKGGGVDTSSIMVVDTATSSSIVLIKEDGQRNFLSFKGACHTLAESDITSSLLQAHDCLYIGSAFDLPYLDGEGMLTLLKRARALGLSTAVDTTADATNFALIQPCLKYITYFLPSLREAIALSSKNSPKDAARFFHKFGAETVIIKLGAQGCLLSQEGSQLNIPAYTAKVVDTTGAGDAFVAGFLASCARGASLRVCAAIGNAAGAECVSQIGASGSLQKYEQLHQKYLQNSRCK